MTIDAVYLSEATLSLGSITKDVFAQSHTRRCGPGTDLGFPASDATAGTTFVAALVQTSRQSFPGMFGERSVYEVAIGHHKAKGQS